MGFSGILYRTVNKLPTRSLNGFYGVKIRFDVNPVKIVDYRGMGLANVELTAVNPTSGISFTGFTDRTGSVFMDLDAVTDIIITKDQITRIVQYNGEGSPTYQIDLPFIQNN